LVIKTFDINNINNTYINKVDDPEANSVKITHSSIKNFKVNGNPQKINKNNHTVFDNAGKNTDKPVIISTLRVLVRE
jgi:hypothetical protein